MAEYDGTGKLLKEETTFRSQTPQTQSILPDVSKSFTSIVQIARDVLINPDVAYRAERVQQEQMMHDPMVMGPMQKRMLATAKLEWEVVPEDVENAFQVEAASRVEKIIRRVPRFRELLRNLGMATFRGTGAAEMNWSFDYTNKWWGITNHRPYHGDKITYDIYGNPRLLTRDYQTGGRELTRAERDRLIIHTFDRDDGEFYDGAEAGYVYKGRGVRDTIWPYWFLKQNALRFWVTLLERYGTGFIEGRYPQGNKVAKEAIESVLQNLLNDSKFSNPVPPDATEKNFGIVVHKMEGLSESANLFVQFIEEWAGKHIRIVIEGQEQAQQQSGDGLGSGRAEALEDIFTMYRDYDAGLIEDTLTDQLVGKVQWFNFGYLPFRCLFRFILTKNNYEEQEKRVAAAKNAGVVVPKAWVYETLDIPQPSGDESPNELIDFGASATVGAGPDDGRLFSDGGDVAAFFNGHQPARYDDEFERKHPRRDDGEFGRGTGHAAQRKPTKKQKLPAPTRQQMTPSTRAILAKQTSRLVGADIQRYSEEHNEKQFAKAIGGVSLRDNEPVDVLVTEGGVVRHGVELKTMTDNRQNKIYMKKAAIKKKIAWMRENRSPFHTVVYDDQKVFNAGGDGVHGDEKNRVIYYRRGFGSFRVGNMYRVKDHAELVSLMNTPDRDLPEAARPTSYYPRLSIRSAA